MTPPINIGGDTVDAITIDGTSVSEVTVDGSTVFSAIPDSLVDNRWEIDAGSGSTLDADVGTTTSSITSSVSWVSNSKYTGGAAVDLNGGNIITDSDIDINATQSEVLWWSDGLNKGGNNFEVIISVGDTVSSTTLLPDNGYAVRYGGNSSGANEVRFEVFDAGSRTNGSFNTIVDTSSDDYFWALRVDGNTAGLRLYDASGVKQTDISLTDPRGTSAGAKFRYGDADLDGDIDDIMAVQGGTLTESQEKDIAAETSR